MELIRTLSNIETNRSKNMYKLLCVLTLVMLGGCNLMKTVVCKVEEQVVDKGPSIVASQLNCQGEAAIREDMKALMDKINLCKKEDASPGADVCKALSGVLVEQLAKQGIPTDWKCSPDATVDKLKSAIGSLCEKIE